MRGGAGRQGCRARDLRQALPPTGHHRDRPGWCRSQGLDPYSAGMEGAFPWVEPLPLFRKELKEACTHVHLPGGETEDRAGKNQVLGLECRSGSPEAGWSHGRGEGGISILSQRSPKSGPEYLGLDVTPSWRLIPGYTWTPMPTLG